MTENQLREAILIRLDRLGPRDSITVGQLAQDIGVEAERRMTKQRRKFMNKPLQLRSALLSKGLTVSEWARTHDFNQRTVSRVIHTWLGRPDDRPRGFKTRAILKELSDTLGVQLNPSV